MHIHIHDNETQVCCVLYLQLVAAQQWGEHNRLYSKVQYNKCTTRAPVARRGAANMKFSHTQSCTRVSAACANAHLSVGGHEFSSTCAFSGARERERARALT